MTWPMVRMRDCFRVTHGFAFKGEYFDSAGQYVLLTPGSFHEQGGFKDQGGKTKFYTGDVPNGYILAADDLVVAMTEQAPGLLGSSALIPETDRFLHNQRLGRIVDLDEKRLDRRFLYYLFNTGPVRHQISATATGGKVRHTAPDRIGQVEVRLPPLETQTRIARILTAYDDLTENNRRRMVLLEDAARHLYQEWFVRLRFPGREHTAIVDGVPRGWQPRSLGNCSTFSSGGTPSKSRSDFWEGDIPWVSSGELTALRIDDASLHVTEEGVEAGSRLVPPNTILAVVRGMSLAKEFRLAMTSRAVCFNQDLKAIVAAADVDADFLFHALVSQRDAIRDRAGEASHGTKKLDTPVLASTPVLLPPRMIQTAFSDFVTPLNAQWDNLSRQSVKLRAARDLLLPRLMSGEVAA